MKMDKFAKNEKNRGGGELSPSDNGGAAMRRGTMFAAIAALCVAIAPAPSSARTVAVTGYNADTRTVSLSFGGTADGVESLYVAYGNSDFGETLEAWPNKVELDSSLAANATSGEYTLPAAVGGYFRFFTGNEITLPYDYEVTYLESTGTQYIDSGLVGAWGDVWQGSFRFTQASPGNCFIVAAWKEGRYTPLQYSGSGFVTIVNDQTSYTASFTCSPGNTTTNNFTAALMSGSQTLDVNGTCARTTKETSAVKNMVNTYIFARNRGTSVDGYAKIQLYNLKLWQDGVPALDLIPVVKDGVGYMYNRVNGAMLANKGTGAFGFDSSTRVSEGGTRLKASAVSKASYLGTLTATSIDWDAKEATLSFPALPAAATLWAVYTTTADPGAFSPNAWDKYTKLADMPSGATGGVYAFPDVAGPAHDYKLLRFVIAGADDDATLFDYEVKYLETDGTQFIDTGYVGGWNDVWSGKFRFTDTAAGFIAASRKGGSERYTVLQWNGSSFVVLTDATVAQNVSIAPASVGTDVDYEFSMAFYNGFQAFNVNGTAKPLYCYGPIKNDNTPVHLFHRHGASADDGPAKVQMDWFRLVRDGVTALDLVPVVKNGEGGFYNKVNGAFLGAASGSGDFNVAALVRSSERTGYAPLMTSDACADGVATTPVVECGGIALNATTGTVDVAWTLVSAGATSNAADIYAVISDANGTVVTNLLVAGASVGSGTAVVSNAFCATVCRIALFARSADGDSVTTAPASFTNTGTASTLDNSAFLVSADAGVVAVAGALSTFGSGTTYAWVEYGTASGSLTNRVDLPTLVNDGTSATQEYACAIGATAEMWDEGKVYARIVCSNEVQGVFEKFAWSAATSVKNTAVKETCTYTWTGGAAGAWSDTANWSAEGYSHYGYPHTDGVTAAFPAGTVATVTLSEDVSIATLDVSGAGIGLVFSNVSGAIRTFTCKDVLDTADDGTSLSFDRVSFMPCKGYAASTPLNVASGSSLVFLPGTSNSWTHAINMNAADDATDYLRGETDFRPGSFHIASGNSAFLCVGGEGLLRIGGTVSVSDLTYAYFSMGGGTIQIYGESPSLTVARGVRAKLKATGIVRNVDANLEFLLPHGGWGSENAVIKGTSTGEQFGGTDAQRAGLDLKLRISVPDESPAFCTPPLRATNGNHLLIDWPVGINTNGVELVNGGRNKQRLFYTWSKDPTDTTPPADGGLPKCVWVNYTAHSGLVIIVK